MDKGGPINPVTTDVDLEALYLAAVKAERWEDADELRAIRRQRREHAAGNVFPLRTKINGH